MSPYDRIRSEYATFLPNVNWGEMVGYYLAYGAVISTPHCCALVRPFIRGSALDDLTPRDPSLCDTWLVQAMAGDMSVALRALPYPLPFIAWERLLARHRELRFYSLTRVRDILESQ